jgi:hypothetical protein
MGITSSEESQRPTKVGSKNRWSLHHWSCLMSLVKSFFILHEGASNSLTCAETCCIAKTFRHTLWWHSQVNCTWGHFIFLPHVVFLYLIILGIKRWSCLANISILFVHHRYSCHGGEECPAHAYDHFLWKGGHVCSSKQVQINCICIFSCRHCVCYVLLSITS